MTRIAWVCLAAGLLAVGVAIWNKGNADKARAAAEQAIDLAQGAVTSEVYGTAVATAERQARAWCQSRGQKVAALQIVYADGAPSRAAVLCSQEISL